MFSLLEPTVTNLLFNEYLSPADVGGIFYYDNKKRSNNNEEKNIITRNIWSRYHQIDMGFYSNKRETIAGVKRKNGYV